MAKNSIGDLAAILARKQKIGKKEANDMVTAFFATITDGLRDDRQVKRPWSRHVQGDHRQST